ncbi:acylphosphatase [Phaeocystidibacter luteus]|uniref:acylphosphatase n=2 Tax=Phaeocystidibacter luteus TaxID=911197 RepID=A0A6N6RCV9_9FLAO|nr:acylphosphatase [Phaeocystidibacter luteus]
MMRWRITIYGRVQGVFYRKSTQQKARQLGLVGWVMNRPDGSVLAEIQGTEELLQEMVDWCWQGPPACDVIKIEKTEVPVEPSEAFEIRI